MCVVTVSAQDKCPVKFGHVTPEDFDISKYKVDSNANGVIIADYGTSSYTYNFGGFSIEYTRQRRVKIINKNGFDLATVEIQLYNEVENLLSVKATTYNLENGKVVETKLPSDAIFDTKEDDNHTVKKFTLPAIKEGTIIEYSYTVKSLSALYLRPWIFQTSYPTVWSEYEAHIPDFIQYVFLSQGYEPYYKNVESSHADILIRGTDNDYDWCMRNVPAIKEEKFTTTINNYVAKIEFQLSSLRIPNQIERDYMDSWQKVTDDLLKDQYFGGDLNKNNGWLHDDIKSVTQGAISDDDKARLIYYYVKNNIKCTDQNGIVLTKSIKQTFKDKNGSVADINLLLVAMLRYINLKANPIILSTREHGYINKIYPLVSKFNYVICQLVINGDTSYLDATKSYLGFARLDANCYNGQARTVDSAATPVYFLADSLSERKVTIATVLSDSSDMVANVQFNPGYYESSDIRKKITAKGKDDFIENIKLGYTDEAAVSNVKFKYLDSCEKPLQMKYAVTYNGYSKDDVIYFNPMLGSGYKENYFKSAERKYPVEMPYTMDETYLLNMKIPDGYEIDELPKSVRVVFNDEEDGFFEYMIEVNDNMISLRSRIKLTQATFDPDEYQTLRNFFDYIVKKHNEQFVFKKKTK